MEHSAFNGFQRHRMGGTLRNFAYTMPRYVLSSTTVLKFSRTVGQHMSTPQLVKRSMQLSG